MKLSNSEALNFIAQWSKISDKIIITKNGKAIKLDHVQWNVASKTLEIKIK